MFDTFTRALFFINQTKDECREGCEEEEAEVLDTYITSLHTMDLLSDEESGVLKLQIKR